MIPGGGLERHAQILRAEIRGTRLEAKEISRVDKAMLKALSGVLIHIRIAA